MVHKDVMGHSSPGGVCGKYSAAATAARLPTHERQRLALTEESRSVGVGGLLELAARETVGAVIEVKATSNVGCGAGVKKAPDPSKTKFSRTR